MYVIDVYGLLFDNRKNNKSTICAGHVRWTIMDVTSEKSEVWQEAYNYIEDNLKKRSRSFYNIFIKRMLGFFIALTLFILLLPVMFIISVVIVVDSGFPYIYKAERGGYKRKSFIIYKFRTMVNNADKIGGRTTALDDKRITKIGKFLRKTKLDEIPQLINIIKGEMSFVGPRPELLIYTSQYKGIENYILEVRPGITDFSSIEFIDLDNIVGRENADEIYEKYVLRRKNYLRLKYVSSVSFLVDCKLFLLTVIKTINKAIKILFKTAGDASGKSLIG
jgi:lipopolysaccharide/colanic/teichoic acid biosynthesis glycosyltransferase